MPRLGPPLVTRAAPLPTRAAQSVPLFWDVVDLFDTDPGEWQLTNSRFELRRWVDLDGRWLLTAILDALTLAPSYRRLLSWINVKLVPPSPRAGNGAHRADWFRSLAQVFDERGYSRGRFPLSFVRRLRGSRAHAAERRWIETLFTAGPNGAAAPRTRSESAVWAALRAFSGDRAGEWIPVNAGYELRRPFAVLDRAGGTLCTKLHANQGDQGGRVVRRQIVVDASVTVWLPELTRRELGVLWDSGWHLKVARALRSLGYRGGWQKIRGQQPFGDFWKYGLPAIEAVRVERDVLARFRLPPAEPQ